jgi:hypothetical protein
MRGTLRGARPVALLPAPLPISRMTTPDLAFFAALERRRTQALVHRDMPVVEDLHADDYELISPAGRALSRAEYLGLVADAPFYTDWALGPLRARIDGAITVLRYPATLCFPSRQLMEVWHTDVYERRGGRWQAVWSQATERRAPARLVDGTET